MTDTLADNPSLEEGGPAVAPPPPPPSGGGPLGWVRRRWNRTATWGTWDWVQATVSFVTVAGCSLFVFAALGPSEILADTTPAGGDMGAHVWAPAFLRDSLLPDLRLSGWAPDWYAGFPAFKFYMVVPSLAIALLSYVMPYGIAFKLVSISGLVTLPIAAWAFGRLTRLPFPIPPLLAVASTWFMFDLSFSIYGGNVASTLAGMFAFSISLTFALLYLGVLGRGLQNGRHRAAAAVLLALTVLNHQIPLYFALAGTVVWFLLHPGRARFRYIATVLPVAGLLSAFWSLPFLLRHGYMNDMGWEKKLDWVNYLFTRDDLDPQLIDAPGIRYVLALAAVGALMALVHGLYDRNRAGLFWVLMAAIAAVAFVLLPQGRLWNARLLPFYYLSLYFLAAIGVGYVGRTVATLFARDPRRPLRSVEVGTAVLGFVVGLLVVALPLRMVPFGSTAPDGGFRVPLLPEVRTNSFVDSWARWNFSGYERKPAWPEYHGIVSTMAEVGREHGCGRAMWEHEEQHDRYGTPMALMLLPFWTDGCIASMEGLYFESSATTPYHFINQDALSSAPSNAQRDLPYGPGPPSRADFDRGVEQLQMFGVRYYMAISDRMIEFADLNESLTEVAGSGPWRVYMVSGSEIVAPLSAEPAVIEGLPRSGDEWLEPSMDWYSDPAAWDVPLAAGGPPQWQRIAQGETPELRPLPPVEVSDIEYTGDGIRFRVDRTGVPVVVRVSFFPNWSASGAEGPWRITPNLMVVVPTSEQVELRYGWTPIDVGSWLLTLLGVAGLVWLARAGPVDIPPPRPRTRRPPRTPTGPDDGELTQLTDDGEPPLVPDDGEPPLVPDDPAVPVRTSTGPAPGGHAL